ncbi:MAG: DEAD/DEAH box helicase [Verrucomicrobiae bacterium]|nr:DEAD/DEAH box helicase [Verrucomicrobiae bacterium]NNJ43012.1 DEAD/DEAH box helicase [Akkermansiaceae bacterium]
MKKFSDLGLSEELLRAVTDKGYDTPSPVQAEAIPAVLKRRDVLAAAQTGTGKTAGFTLPMIQILDETGSQKPSKGRPIRALVLTPTRELAAQVQESIKTYGVHTHLRSAVVFGGVKINPQIRQLRDGVDILVATPGRLLDLCQQRACKLDQVNMLVLDEADRMLDMGFINDIRKVIKLMPKKRQNLLFSATFSKEIRHMTRELLIDPITIEVSPKNTAAQTVSQRAYRCDKTSKTKIAIKLIRDGDWEQVLIFTRTKHGANRLSKSLDQAGIQSSAIHGNKGQGARTKALAGFKEGSVRVLVATDIAARGLDIANLPHVINFELPNVPEDYVHRIGRTGRAGQEGEAVSLVCNNERPYLQGIEKIISQKIPLIDLNGFEPELWPAKGPTASEVQKEEAARKKAARQAQGGGRRKSNSPKPSGPKSDKSDGSLNPPAGHKAGGRGRRSGPGASRRRNPRGR